MKTAVKTIAMAASIVGLLGTAQAATREINIYGASAQYLYWNDAADDFLTAKGCSSVSQAQDSSKKHGITRGLGCTQFGGDDVIIRYSAKASFESVRSLKGTTNPDSCGSAYERKMADSVSNPNNLTCKRVHLGASDVAGESFVQSSSGQKFGPLGGGYVSYHLTGEDASGLKSDNPLVVPFGFFVNNAVTARKCASTAPNFGAYCASDTDCGGAAGSCLAAATIDNITRLQAVQIFSASVSDWSDFGAYFTAQPIVACLRHAGSGTAAALAWTVMKGNGWGYPLYDEEIDGAFYFNESSTDLMKCVNGNDPNNPNGSAIGAIGYADADQTIGTPGTSQNVKAIRYNGVWPSRYALRNGEYDFWTTQWVYQDENALTTAQKAVVNALISYASDPTKLPTGKRKWWATKDEMKFFRANDPDFVMYQGGAANPQTP